MDLPVLRPHEKIRASRFIVIGDVFKDYDEVLELFGHAGSGKGKKSSTYFFGTKKVVWFPQIAVENNEHCLVPPNNIEWCNTLSSDYTELLQRRVSGAQKNAEDSKYDNLALEFAVFAKLPKAKEYTFLGIYRKQPQKDLYGSEVYHQKERELCIDDWTEAKKNAKQK
jgi:hypothetical protein